MYKQIEKYLDTLISNSSAEFFMWNVEKYNSKKGITWNYIDGCMLNSLLELFAITNNKSYLNFVEQAVDRMILADGQILTYNIEKYSLDDICESRILFKLFEITKKDKYLKAIEYTYQQILNQPRTKENNFWHKLIYPNQVWLDGLYMAMPFYVSYLNYHHQNDYQDIINQYKNVEAMMKDFKTGLYYHGYDSSKTIFWADSKTGLSKNFWLRSIGWFLVSLVEVFELIQNNEDKAYIKKLLTELVNNILKYQDQKSMMFYQVVNLGHLEGNYLETSGSSMIAYSILKAVRLGILDTNYQDIGKGIFDGIYRNYFCENNGEYSLGNICLVAGLGPSDNLRRDGSYEYYISEPIVKNDAKGVAPFIMAYIELKRGGLC